MRPDTSSVSVHISPETNDVDTTTSVYVQDVGVSTKRIFMGNQSEFEHLHECGWKHEHSIDDVMREKPPQVHLRSAGYESCFDTKCTHCGASAYERFLNFYCCFDCGILICQRCGRNVIKRSNLHENHDCSSKASYSTSTE